MTNETSYEIARTNTYNAMNRYIRIAVASGMDKMEVGMVTQAGYDTSKLKPAVRDALAEFQTAAAVYRVEQEKAGMV